jgi:peptide deformylase
MRRTVLEHPDPRLRIVAQPVTAFDDALRGLVDDLFETMHAGRAIGLAATQVDVHQRVVVLDVSGTASEPQVFINPEILSGSAIGMVEESCMSVPGVLDSVRRATRVRVRAQDGGGQSFERRLDGLAAVCLLHEIDHLDGKLFVDRLSYLRRLRWRWRLGRERRAAAA